MRKYCLIFMLLLTSSIYAQTPYKVYAELVGKGREVSAKRTITVDFGRGFKYWSRNAKDYLVDENGDKLSFNSMVDAMNYMSKRGWQLAESYYDPLENDLFWIIYKEITTDEQIREGLMTKEEFKKR